jgi:hypothetical protein
MVISGSRRLPVWAWCVGLALVSSAISGVLVLLATDGDLREIFYIERLVAHAPENAELFRWAMVLDMLGYYVLLAPLFVAVGRRLYDLGELGAALWTIGALMYVTAGSVAAMALAYGVPPLLRGYAQASIGVAMSSVAVLFAGLRATGVQSEPVLYVAAAVLGVAIWAYVLGLTGWLWREVGASAIRTAEAAAD